MGLLLLNASIVIISIAFIVNYISSKLTTHLPIYIDSDGIDPRFQSVEEAFRQNFLDGWEKGGAAFVVYQNGRKVVDLWGGYADVQAARKWRKDTITVVFSLTKAVAALCIGVLVDRAHLAYDDRISEFWPEFGKNGKANITVQMVLSHMAGLAYIDEEITEEKAADHEAMRKILENAQPNWPPGEKTGYHVYTFGWLVDQIIRHVDERKRGIGQFFREEIALKYGIDFHIGLPKCEDYRVARMTLPSYADMISEILTDFRCIKFSYLLLALHQDTILRKAVTNPSWLEAVSKLTLNNPDYRRLEQAAALGIGNARSIAKLFDLLSFEKLVSIRTRRQLLKPYVNDTDIVILAKKAKGNGFMFFSIPPKTHSRIPVEKQYAIGHTGHGCQQIIYDPVRKISMVYVSNGLKIGLYKLCRTYARLHEAVYHVLEPNGENIAEEI